MDKRISKLIEMCRFKDDVDTWGKITSELFNGLDFENLGEWHTNRDRIINGLFDKIKGKQNLKIYSCSNPIGDYFERENDGSLITRGPTFFDGSYGFFKDEVSGVVIANKKVYLGGGVRLLDSVVRSNAYIGSGAQIINSRILSTKNTKDQSTYVGKDVILEDVLQVCKSVIGSSIPNPTYQIQNTYWHGQSLNGAIVGGSSGASMGVDMMSHQTCVELTKLVDPISHRFLWINNKSKGRTPTIIGSDVLIGDGAQIVSPLIIASGNRVGRKSYGEGRPILNGLIDENGDYYSPSGF